LKIRESGMPDENVWHRFFDPIYILKSIGLTNKVEDIADFGCGYGTFIIPAAKIISGVAYAIDSEAEMIMTIRRKTLERAVYNVYAIQKDLLNEGSGLVDEKVDYVSLFNILHTKYPLILLKEAHRVLKKNGCVAITNWNVDPKTPRGPPLKMRPSVEECVKWCIISGFKRESKTIHDFKPHHYGLVMRK
jgi:SAM-dependent methyltransferase